MNQATFEAAIVQDKELRRDIDAIIQRLRRDSDNNYTGERAPDHPVRGSRERSLAITKLQEAVMWLGMDLKAINDACPGIQENPYPESKNPENLKIEKTADGLKL